MLPTRDGVGEVRTLLTEWIEALKKRIDVDAVVVFGSRATNTHWRNSDIDVAVVSPDFAGMLARDRAGLMLEVWPGAPTLEPMGYTPEELKHPDFAELLVLLDALHQGRVLMDTGPWEAAVARLTARIDSGDAVPTAGGWKFRRDPDTTRRLLEANRLRSE